MPLVLILAINVGLLQPVPCIQLRHYKNIVFLKVCGYQLKDY